jgi:hypothetical protein
MCVCFGRPNIKNKKNVYFLSAGDAEFSKFLQSEIKYAKENDTSAPVDLKGWHIASDGADVTLSKTSGNET